MNKNTAVCFYSLSVGSHLVSDTQFENIRLVSLLNEAFKKSTKDLNLFANREKAIQVSQKIIEIDNTVLNGNITGLCDRFFEEFRHWCPNSVITYIGAVKEKGVIKAIEVKFNLQENGNLISVEFKNIIPLCLEDGNTLLASTIISSRPEMNIPEADHMNLEYFFSFDPNIALHSTQWKFEKLDYKTNFLNICGFSTISYILDSLIHIALEGMRLEDFLKTKSEVSQEKIEKNLFEINVIKFKDLRQIIENILRPINDELLNNIPKTTNLDQIQNRYISLFDFIIVSICHSVQRVTDKLKLRDIFIKRILKRIVTLMYSLLKTMICQTQTMFWLIWRINIPSVEPNFQSFHSFVTNHPKFSVTYNSGETDFNLKDLYVITLKAFKDIWTKSRTTIRQRAQIEVDRFIENNNTLHKLDGESILNPTEEFIGTCLKFTS